MSEEKFVTTGSLQVAGEVCLHWRLLAFEGVVLAAFGIIAIAGPELAIVAINLLLGCLFVGVGLLGLVTTLMARDAPGFWWGIASAIAAIAAGIALIVWPLRGFYAISIVLAGLLVFDGVMTIMIAIAHKRRSARRWLWLAFSGALDLLLAPLILLVTFVTETIWLLPDVIGIDLVVGGASLIAVALAARPD